MDWGLGYACTTGDLIPWLNSISFVLSQDLILKARPQETAYMQNCVSESLSQGRQSKTPSSFRSTFLQQASTIVSGISMYPSAIYLKWWPMACKALLQIFFSQMCIILRIIKKKQHINDLHGLWYIELGFKSLIYYLLTLWPWVYYLTSYILFSLSITWGW